MNYTLYTTRGPQLSLYSLAPSFRVSLPPCFFLSCDTGTVCWCKPVVSLVLLSLLRCQHRPLFVTSRSFSVLSAWLFLQRCIRAPNGGKNICSSQKSGRDGERRDIWENHQEDFTHLTFTCLHAVNITPWFFWMSRECWPPEGETGRGERERQGWKV